MSKFIYYICNVVDILRFGKVTARPMADVADIVSEIAYVDKKGIIVGYWAYGCYDPSLPYPTKKH